MKKFKDIEEFENLLKDNLGKHSVPAPPDVWSGVSSSVAGSSSSALSQFTSYFSSISNVIKVAFFVGGISAVGIVLYNENTQSIPTTESEQIIPSTEESTSATENDESLDDVPLDKPSQPNTVVRNSTSTNKSGKGTTSNASETPNASENVVSNNQSSTQNQLNTTPSETEQTVAIRSNQVILSNMKPCVGEIITLSNAHNLKGDWYVNGKKISSNSSYINYTWKEGKNTVIEFKRDSFIIQKQVASAAVSTTIQTTNTQGDEYLFNLAQSSTIANWYVNGELVLTNSNQLKHEFNKVGMHHIKAVPVNHACSSPIETHVSIKAKGELVTYNIFTPNGDGKNDTYQVEITHYESYSIQIFNSENVKVFASNNPAISWDGTDIITGEKCPNGEYAAKIAYKLIGEESTIKNIKLTLIRN